MFNKPAKFEKQLSRGAISVSKDANHTGSPTSVISKSTVEEVQSVNDGEDQKVDKATENKLAEYMNQIMFADVFLALCYAFLAYY
jgi:hypothetical protein